MTKTTAADGLLDEMDSVPAPRTRRRPMLWQRLGEGKDPEFNKQYFLTNGEDFYVGQLESIRQTETGKAYGWNIDGEDEPRFGSTHFCEPQQP